MKKLDRRLKKLNARKLPAIELLRENGIDPMGWPDRQIIEKCYSLLGHNSAVRYVSYASLMARYTWIGRMLPAKAGVVVDSRSAGHAEVPIAERRHFYQSAEWKRMRVTILERDGATCRLCGGRGDRGAIVNVDHIRPLKFHWDLRLDPTNLQVLCADCNEGKGNRYLKAAPIPVRSGLSNEHRRKGDRE